ncbi:hypothetical protein FYK55_08260 [Roseiconus nitratireducens]|uniref:Acyl carrier protein phosphodiesterase n=1 Tax=Roseiconus nitratireducens TaxID=2605748 RepID=A0A5M6DAD3_9BACT|nr:hypothetical protein [Roseiconus nitratireducens]KAA5544333.1 hypothetical protein FYK55_08260 [Roseiconus nitratireducens]
MNFLCHAIPYLDDPLIAVCTAVPDWLSVTDRRIRARERMATAVLDSDDPAIRQVAAGILHHIRDDRWFHNTQAFAETNLTLAVQLRERLPGDAGFRPMFVGHILIEVLLDSFWIRDQPEWGERYYALVESESPELIQRCVNEITGRPTDRLAATIRRYVEARFLYDYGDHERLLFRLNQVMRRVGLNELPPSVLPWLTIASELVESRRERFLTPPDGSSPFPPIP